MKFRWIRYIAERLPKEIRERRKTEIEACFTGTKKQLEEKLVSLNDEKEALEADVERLSDPDYIAKYVREKYLYSKEGELIIRMKD